jgi:hypothetical protein
VTIKNPATGKIETLNQTEFNKYMSMTNGAVLKWIVDSAQIDSEINPSSIDSILGSGGE